MDTVEGSYITTAARIDLMQTARERSTNGTEKESEGGVSEESGLPNDMRNEQHRKRRRIYSTGTQRRRVNLKEWSRQVEVRTPRLEPSAEVWDQETNRKRKMSAVLEANKA